MGLDFRWYFFLLYFCLIRLSIWNLRFRRLYYRWFASNRWLTSQRRFALCRWYLSFWLYLFNLNFFLLLLLLLFYLLLIFSFTFLIVGSSWPRFCSWFWLWFICFCRSFALFYIIFNYFFARLSFKLWLFKYFNNLSYNNLSWFCLDNLHFINNHWTIPIFNFLYKNFFLNLLKLVLPLWTPLKNWLLFRSRLFWSYLLLLFY